MSFERMKCEEEIKYLIDFRYRFRQYLKENLNTIWYSHAQNYFEKDCQILKSTLMECICDLVHINELLTNETHDDFLLELKKEKLININELNQDIYFNRRYRALINSREILLDDLSQTIDQQDLENRIIKLRAICVLDEELFHLQEKLFYKSFEEQLSIRLHQIRTMIDRFFQQTSYENSSLVLSLIDSCDSFISTFRLFLNLPISDISYNSLSDIENE